MRALNLKDVFDAVLKLPLFALTVVLCAAVAMEAASAANDRSISIDAFSTPTDFPAQGLSGQVLASWLYDRLEYLELSTMSDRAPDVVNGEFGPKLKVEVPETGLSLDDIHNWLVSEFGARQTISGDVVRVDGSLQITLHSTHGAPIVGPATDSNLREQLNQLTDHLFFEVSPYRYAEYLYQRGCVPAAGTIAHYLIDHGDEVDRDWSYGFVAGLEYDDGDFVSAIGDAQREQHVAPHLPLRYAVLAQSERALGRLSQAEADFTSYRNDMERPENASATAGNHVGDYARRFTLEEAEGDIAENNEDYSSAEAHYQNAIAAAMPNTAMVALELQIASDLAFSHHLVDAIKTYHLAETRDEQSEGRAIEDYQIFIPPSVAIPFATEDWSSTIQAVDNFESQKNNQDEFLTSFDQMYLDPIRALAQAKLGMVGPVEAWLRDSHAPAGEVCWDSPGAVPAATMADTCEPYMRMRILTEIALGRLHDADFDAGALQKRAPRAAATLYLLARLRIAEKRYGEAYELIRWAQAVAPRWAEPIELEGEYYVQQAKAQGDDRSGDLLAALARFKSIDGSIDNWPAFAQALSTIAASVNGNNGQEISTLEKRLAGAKDALADVIQAKIAPAAEGGLPPKPRAPQSKTSSPAAPSCPPIDDWIASLPGH